jgi:hypothetical protein
MGLERFYFASYRCVLGIDTLQLSLSLIWVGLPSYILAWLELRAALGVLFLESFFIWLR